MAMAIRVLNFILYKTSSAIFLNSKGTRYNPVKRNRTHEQIRNPSPPPQRLKESFRIQDLWNEEEQEESDQIRTMSGRRSKKRRVNPVGKIGILGFAKKSLRRTPSYDSGARTIWPSPWILEVQTFTSRHFTETIKNTYSVLTLFNWLPQNSGRSLWSKFQI